MQPKDKIRIYELAKKLGVESKDLLDRAKELGISARNQLSSIDPDHAEALKASLRGGTTATATAPPPPPRVPTAPRPTNLDNRVKSIPAAPKPQSRPSRPEEAEGSPDEAPLPAAAPVVQAREAEPEPEALPPEAPELVAEAPHVEPEPPPAEEQAAVEQDIPADPEPQAKAEPEAPPEETARPPEPEKAATQPEPPAPPPAGRARVPDLGGRPRNLNAPRPTRNLQPPSRPAQSIAPRPPERLSPSDTPQPVPPPASPSTAPRPTTPLRGIRQEGRPGAKSPPGKEDRKGPAKTAGLDKLTPEQMRQLREGGKIDVNAKPKPEPPLGQQRPGTPAAPGATPARAEEDDRSRGPAGPGAVSDRERRQRERQRRAEKRKRDGSDTVEVVGGQVVVRESERRGRYGRGRKQQKHRGAATKPRVGKVPLTVPITVRSFSEAVGIKANDVLKNILANFREEVGLPTINTLLADDIAILLAGEFGVDVEIRKQADVEDEMLAVFDKEDDPDDLVPRAPIVAVLGHVDHGKTSLLDKIRKSNVVDTEAGGITQVIRAWRVEHDGKPVTFLDTPGHEAFTAMRARGADVTDICVIVVAADDGVMPQTEEAINHAKAAEVEIVVAINKIDLPNANVSKTEQQLYSMGLLPDNMGGDTQFVYTSAAKGEGIDDLLEAISLVAELAEYQANPSKPGVGTCLEAHMSGDEGVFATLLVQDGTLRRGDVILCGASHGRVRAMYDDLGRPIDEAGPSVPVRITGLDTVPNADDAFHIVPDLDTAREISEKRAFRLKELEVGTRSRIPMRLESINEQPIDELKVILKADYRGSIEAIKKEMSKFSTHDEVRVRVLHTGIGGITEGDVQLALTSPNDTMLVGFNAVPDEKAMKLAENRGIRIREYNIIYKLTEDVKAALEGKLKPIEETVHLGRAVVRETFKISRVGTIAGCYVTQGTIERNAKVRVIRDGTVIFPPAERSAGLESLKRFKDDVRDVREGMECGIKVAGYDDIKVDDVIEAYKIQEIQRTL